MESIEDILKRRKEVAKKIIVYMNEKGEKVEKEEATNFMISEYDKDGNLINSIHGICNTNEKKEDRGDER